MWFRSASSGSPSTHRESAASGPCTGATASPVSALRSEEHTSELQSLTNLVCRLLLEKFIDYQDWRPWRFPFRFCTAGQVHRNRRSAGIRSTEGGAAGPVGRDIVLFFLMIGRPRGSPLFPYPAPFR